MLLNGSTSQVNGGENCAAERQREPGERRTGEKTVLGQREFRQRKLKRRCERSEHLSYVYISIFATFRQNIVFVLFFKKKVSERGCVRCRGAWGVCGVCVVRVCGVCVVRVGGCVRGRVCVWCVRGVCGAWVGPWGRESTARRFIIRIPW